VFCDEGDDDDKKRPVADYSQIQHRFINATKVLQVPSFSVF